MQEKDVLKKIHKIVSGITHVKGLYVNEKDLVLDYVTIFCHTPQEFNELVSASMNLGKQVDEHNGPVFLLNEPIKFENGVLRIFRVRKPDKERPQVGCGDFGVPDYREFKKKYIKKKYFQLFKGDGYEFLGIHDLRQEYLVYFPNVLLSKDLNL